MLRRSAACLVLLLTVAGCGPSGPTGSAQGAADTAGPSVAVSAAPPESQAAPTSTPAPVGTASPTATPMPTATPVPTTSPTPTLARTPTPWKTYRSKRFHYTMKYAPEWIVTPGSAKMADQFDDFASRFVFAERDTVSGVVSLSMTVTRQVALFKTHYKAKVLSKSSLRVAGWPARMITYKGVRDGQALYIQELIIGKGSIGYFVTWFSDYGTIPADKAFFKKMYSTFRPTR